MANQAAVHVYEQGFTVLYEAPDPKFEYVSFDFCLQHMLLGLAPGCARIESCPTTYIPNEA
jgi:hypothetical protein